MIFNPETTARLQARLEVLYGEQASDVLPKLQQLIEVYRTRISPPQKLAWDERDVVLITYGDQIRAAGETPLATLKRFLMLTGLNRHINTVHLLPFFPYSSDDGFSVIDYRQVDPALGSWEDIATLGRRFHLMYDLVLNHCSQHSGWFQNYLIDEEPGRRYFIEVDPDVDLSQVTRPRNLPLLTPFETNRGVRHVWTTFSGDQIDLNFAEPDLLIDMLAIFLFYIESGARIVRLDAIAYLWKEIGTSCIHLPQTHEVVKLMRDLVDGLAPGTLLLTETNVPHAENVSYFGAGDEAHMVYQFSLAPLLLDALLTGDAGPLTTWLRNLAPSPPGTTYFNFTASHDGVGVRPLEGLVSPERVERLVESVKERGGRISYKRNSDGSESPYELNITYYSALAPADAPDSELHRQAFLASQAMMLALRGIPGIYFHSLIATPNDQQGAEESGHARRINRRKFDWPALQARLADEDSMPAQVLAGYQHLLAVRIEQPAFHPEGDQQVWDVGHAALLAFLRTSPDRRQHVLVVANVSREPQTMDLAPHGAWKFGRDLLSQETTIETNQQIHLAPYQVAWLLIEPT